MNTLTDISIIPMKIIEEIEALQCNSIDSKTIIGVDDNYHIYIYFRNIERITKTSLLADLTGRGLTYKDACIDYIYKLLDDNYKIRMNGGYATKKIRDIINQYKFLEYYKGGENFEAQSKD
jgi:hypothetical protein